MFRVLFVSPWTSLIPPLVIGGPPGQRLSVDYKSHFAQFGSKVMTRFQIVAHHFRFVMTSNKPIGYNLSGISANTD